MTETAGLATPTPPEAAPVHRCFIAGAWVGSVSGRTFESRNPADGRDVVGHFQAGTAADVAMAVRAAEMALPAWRATPAPKRGEILYRFGQLLADHKERVARAMRALNVVHRLIRGMTLVTTPQMVSSWQSWSSIGA